VSTRAPYFDNPGFGRGSTLKQNVTINSVLGSNPIAIESRSFGG